MSDAENAFESGYNQTTTAATETPAKVEVRAASEPEAKTEQPDPIKTVLERLDKFEASHNKLSGSVGNLFQQQKAIQETLAAAQAATKQVQDSPTQAEIKDAMSSPQEWEQLKAQFPEWATATEKFMDAKLAGVKPANIDPNQISEIVNQRVQGESASVRKEIIYASLDAVFPDWQADIKTPQFDEWMKKQAPEIQALLTSDHVRDAARMLKLYEQSKTITAAPKVSSRQKLLEANIQPKGTGGHAPSSSGKSEFESGYYT